MMKIIVQGKQGLKIDDSLVFYATEKVRKYEKIVAEPTICEIVLADEFGKKDGNDKSVHITLTIPQEKNPLHVEAVSSDFMGSLDLAQEKLEREIIRWKDRKKIGPRFPKEYEESKIEEEKDREL